MTADSTKKRLTFCLGKAVWLGLSILLCGFPCWSQQAPVVHTAKSAVPDSRSTEPSTAGQQTDQQPSGSISGKVVDQTGANISGALVKLTQQGQFSTTEAFSDDGGQFSLSNVAPGPFQLTITSPGLASQEFSGILHPGESCVTPIIMLTIATQVTEVHVALPPDELAAVQIKDQEKQSVCSASFRIVTSATFRMQLLSRRSISSSLPGSRLPIRLRSSRWGPWPELIRREIVGAHMGKARKAMPSASQQPTLAFLQVRSSEAPPCLRC